MILGDSYNFREVLKLVIVGEVVRADFEIANVRDSQT